MTLREVENGTSDRCFGYQKALLSLPVLWNKARKATMARRIRTFPGIARRIVLNIILTKGGLLEIAEKRWRNDGVGVEMGITRTWKSRWTVWRGVGWYCRENA